LGELVEPRVVAELGEAVGRRSRFVATRSAFAVVSHAAAADTTGAGADEGDGGDGSGAGASCGAGTGGAVDGGAASITGVASVVVGGAGGTVVVESTVEVVEVVTAAVVAVRDGCARSPSRSPEPKAPATVGKADQTRALASATRKQARRGLIAPKLPSGCEREANLRWPTANARGAGTQPSSQPS
jgi:hypothetical protein